MMSSRGSARRSVTYRPIRPWTRTQLRAASISSSSDWNLCPMGKAAARRVSSPIIVKSDSANPMRWQMTSTGSRFA